MVSLLPHPEVPQAADESPGEVFSLGVWFWVQDSAQRKRTAVSTEGHCEARFYRVPRFPHVRAVRGSSRCGRRPDGEHAGGLQCPQAQGGGLGSSGENTRVHEILGREEVAVRSAPRALGRSHSADSIKRVETETT